MKTPRVHRPASGPHVIHPNCVYSVEDVKRLLGLHNSTIRREVRQGRLRVSKRSGRYFLLGEWILQWLREGELPRRNRQAPGNGQGRGEGVRL
jgi:hypothetical protein